MGATNVRFVVVNGITYLRAEDVAAYVRDVAGSEETDVRNRLTEAAARLQRLDSGELVLRGRAE